MSTSKQPARGAIECVTCHRRVAPAWMSRHFSLTGHSFRGVEEEGSAGASEQIDPQAMVARVASLKVTTGESMLRQGAATQWLLSARVVDEDGVEVGYCAAWFERNPQAGRTIQWEAQQVIHGQVSGSYATRADAMVAVVAAARTMAALTLLRKAQTGSYAISTPPAQDEHSTPSPEQAPAEVVLDPSHPRFGEAGAIWDEHTGETVGQALARFATFGPFLTAQQAIEALTKGEATEVMSFGYGDDPVDFDGIEVEELQAAIAEDGAEAVDVDWGPFAIWAAPDPGNPEVAAEMQADPEAWTPGEQAPGIVDLPQTTLTPPERIARTPIATTLVALRTSPTVSAGQQADAILAAIREAGLDIVDWKEPCPSLDCGLPRSDHGEWSPDLTHTFAN